MKRYIVSGGTHISSYGSINFLGGFSQDKFDKTLKEVFNDFPNSIIVDGSDDWYAKLKHSPSSICKKFNVNSLAQFHTGISGISSSGEIISKKDFRILKKKCKEEGFDITKTCRCYNDKGQV